MKIQYISDLHLDFPENRNFLKENPILPVGDILILAGDIITDKNSKKIKPLLKDFSQNYKQVLFIPGNHEFYDGTINYAFPSYIKEIEKNVLKLNNKTYIIDNYKFICTTLWSYIPDYFKYDIMNGLNDYRLIYKKNMYNEKDPINPDDVNRFHEISKKFIEKELNKPFDGDIIIVTHHLPSFQLLSPVFQQSKLSSAFACNLDDMIFQNKNVKLVIYGHDHCYNDTTINKIRVVSNPLGYVHMEENKDFKRDRFVELN